ncbi:MAG: GLPGLI family protein [Bacteroidota bacterium]
MIKFIQLFVFLLGGFVFAQTSGGKIMYGVDYVGFAKDTAKLQSEHEKNFTLKMEREAEIYLKPKEAFTQLEFNQEFAIYKEVVKMDVDESLSPAVPAIALQADDYFMDLKNVEVYQFGEIKKKKVLIEYDRKINWQIKDEYKTIAGFKCQKAVSETKDPDSFEHVTAWFAVDIPAKAGPHGYIGLPGLILATEARGRYVYAIEVELEEEMQVKSIDDFDAYNLEEYIKAR